MSLIEIAIIDKYPLFRAGIVESFRLEADISIVSVCSSLSEILNISNSAQPSILIIGMTDLKHDLTAIEQLLVEKHPVKILIVADFFNNDIVKRVMQRGVWGAVLRNTCPTEIILAIRTINGGERFIAPILAGQLFSMAAPPKLAPDPLGNLTWREDKIVSLLSEGLSNKEIGCKLSLSEKTIKHYLTIILDKLGVHNRVQAAIMVTNRDNNKVFTSMMDHLPV